MAAFPGPDRDPVAPGGLEADEVAERALRVGVGTDGARKRAAEVGEHEREQDGAGAGERPADHRDGPASAASEAGSRKMPEPIMLPTTSAVAIQRSIERLSLRCGAAGAARLWLIRWSAWV